MNRTQPTTDARFKGKPLNGCSACRQDFTSLRLFELHRVGDHALDWPEHENGRRCLDTEEMRAKGWTQDEKGRWLDPARAEDARRRLGRVGVPQGGPAEGLDEEEAA